MTLIQGINGLSPCPVCLILSVDQADLSETATLCTQENTMEVFNKVQSMTKAEAEKELKPIGLRNVYVCFLSSSVLLYWHVMLFVECILATG